MRKHAPGWKYPTWLSPGWQFFDEESEVFAHSYYLFNRGTGTMLVGETYVEAMQSALLTPAEEMQQGEEYCFAVKAQNNAGSWGEFYTACTTIDVSEPFLTWNGAPASPLPGPTVPRLLPITFTSSPHILIYRASLRRR